VKSFIVGAHIMLPRADTIRPYVIDVNKNLHFLKHAIFVIWSVTYTFFIQLVIIHSQVL